MIGSVNYGLCVGSVKVFRRTMRQPRSVSDV
jgi:hypothetical protein